MVPKVCCCRVEEWPIKKIDEDDEWIQIDMTMVGKCEMKKKKKWSERWG